MVQPPIDDPLTGLANRQSFLDSLQRMLKLAGEQQAGLALLVLDIDRFALANAAHGYGFGDQVLREVAGRLRQLLRRQDVAARIGDNRFALILMPIMNAGHVELAAEKLLRLMDLPIEAPAGRMKLAVTCAAAIASEQACQGEQLFGIAERALAKARHHRQRLRFAEHHEGPDPLAQHWDIEVALAGALQREEMSLHYQPKLRAVDLSLVGAEALMRWHLPGRGMISPKRFIPVAEHGGHIKSLTVWALNTALRQASSWTDADRPIGVAVNVPAEMVCQDDLPELIDNSLRLWGGRPVQLTIEITERSLLADPRRSFRVLSALREQGVRISIDDFGTGYSCLAYFRDIPADELKVDRSFVRYLPHDAASADITALIIDLAHRFGMRVVAEGVEDQAAFETLRRLGCDEVQGFLFARPMPNEAFQSWLRAADRVPVGPPHREA